MHASNYLEQKFLDHLFGKSTFTAPSNIYVALCSAAPGDTDTGSTITEVNYTGYARVQTSPSDWNAWASGIIDNLNAITFPKATGGSATATHFALVDASSGGNLLIWAPLNSSLAISNNIQPSFPAGDLTNAID